MINADPHRPDRLPALEPTTGSLPADLDADDVLTVIDVRTIAAAGFAAGALVPCVPLVVVGAVGIVATILFNRGTIAFESVQTSANGVTPLGVLLLLLVVVTSGALGAILGAVRRWSVRREIHWNLLVGKYFSSHPGPQSVVALVVVPVLVAASLHAVSIITGYSLSFAPIFFLIFPPAWMLSGFMFESAWEALVFPMLRASATDPMKWLLREKALFRLLKDDSYIFNCRLDSVRIDAKSGVAHIVGDFRTPDHRRRVREIGMRVIGISEVEVAATSALSSGNAPAGS